MATTRSRYEELLALPEHLVSEIVNGELVTTPRPRPRHAQAEQRLCAALERDYGARQRGWRFLAEPELHLGDEVLVPDVAGWRVERLPELPADAHIAIDPDGVCEVLSPATVRLDRAVKMDVYGQHGVGCCWLVDVEAELVEVYHREGREWVREAAFVGAKESSPPPFEGDWLLDLAALWER